MGTQQALTTKQFELLTVIYDIEKFGEENGNETDIQEIIVDSKEFSLEEFEEISEALIYYGYLNENREVTIDGKQYIGLFIEYLQEKEKHPDIVINNSFTLINIENLNVGLNAFMDLRNIGEVLKSVSDGVKKVMQAMKKAMH